MPRITTADAQGWGERTKLKLSTLDTDLLDQIESEILARINSVYDTSLWTDESNTPRLIRTIISKMYVSWIYNRQYSENQSETNEYAKLLIDNAEMLITGILDGTIEIVDPGVIPTTAQVASFYPNDVSSAQLPTAEDPSLGPAKFSMGKVF